jgi:uncharacterized protein (DUF1697 family)
MTECIALLRGINVGRAKRIAMADLRGLFVDLGHENVRTLLNSGNVLFRCARPNPAKLALAIQAAISDKCGFSASVTVLTAMNLAAIIRENPLLKVAKDPARHLVAFVAQPSALAPLRAFMRESWAPDALAIGSKAAYLWCAAGVLDSKLSQMFARLAGETVTTRNWATVLKLLAASNAPA